MGIVSVVDITTAAAHSTKMAGSQKSPIAENRSPSAMNCVGELPGCERNSL
jgi:hypothetical protein